MDAFGKAVILLFIVALAVSTIAIPALASTTAIQHITAIYGGPSSTSVEASESPQQLIGSNQDEIAITGSIGYGDLNVASSIPVVVSTKGLTNNGGKIVDIFDPLALTVLSNESSSKKSDQDAANVFHNGGRSTILIIGISPVY